MPENIQQSFLRHIHSEFTDEGILGNPDMELYFLGLVHAIGHTTCNDSGGITTGHCGVDVKAVDIPVLLNKCGGQIAQCECVFSVQGSIDLWVLTN